MEYLLIADAVSAVLFLGVYILDARTLWTGLLFLLTAGLSALILATTALRSENPVLLGAMLLLVVGPIILASGTPLYLTLLSLYSGFKLMIREGISFANSLAFILGAILLTGPFMLPTIHGSFVFLGRWWWVMYCYLLAVVAYFSLHAVGYTIASWLNLFRGGRKADYVVVLGAGLAGHAVTPLLASRINKGIEVYRKNPGSWLILTGGQGPGERLPEGVAMARYARSRGVPERDIIIENRARNTRENLLFSWKLMTMSHAHVVVVTSGYHLFRALLLARSLGLRCTGAGSRTRVYFAVNAFIREFIGYLSITRWQHIIVVLLLSFMGIMAQIVVYFCDIPVGPR